MFYCNYYIKINKVLQCKIEKYTSIINNIYFRTKIYKNKNGGKNEWIWSNDKNIIKPMAFTGFDSQKIQN